MKVQKKMDKKLMSETKLGSSGSVLSSSLGGNPGKNNHKIRVSSAATKSKDISNST